MFNLKYNFDKFSDYLTKKCFPEWPKFATAAEWVEIRKQAKKKKVRFFISKTFPMFVNVQIFNRIDNIKYWFLYRFNSEHKYHLIDTKLTPDYYELDTRMLHGMFSLLVGYVERELAQMHYYTNVKDGDKPDPRTAGLSNLEWQQSLVYDEDEVYNQPELVGTRTPQAKSADEIKELYIWWTEKRPNRPDPYDEINADDFTFDDPMEMLASLSNQDDNSYKKRQILTEAYEQEDTNMLIRLIKIRHRLWT